MRPWGERGAASLPASEGVMVAVLSGLVADVEEEREVEEDRPAPATERCDEAIDNAAVAGAVPAGERPTLEDTTPRGERAYVADDAAASADDDVDGDTPPAPAPPAAAARDEDDRLGVTPNPAKLFPLLLLLLSAMSDSSSELCDPRKRGGAGEFDCDTDSPFLAPAVALLLPRAASSIEESDASSLSEAST